MTKKQLSSQEYGRQGGKSRWNKVKDAKERSKIMQKVSQARAIKNRKQNHE